MPAKKVSGLIKKHETKEEKQTRAAKESAVKPKERLSKTPPPALAGHPIATKLWVEMIRLYGQLEAEIVSLLDRDVLTDYCLITEQLQEMDALRIDAMRLFKQATAELKKLDQPANRKTVTAKEKIQLIGIVSNAFDDIVKLDARVDRKRTLLTNLRQSLYLTPRSRAGVAPQPKKPEEPKSKMDKILSQAEQLHKNV